MSFTRLYDTRIKKALLAAGLSIPLIFGIFWYLSLTGAITITGYSGDVICAGTIDDPCYAYINFTANKDIYIYPMNKSEQIWMFKTDKRLKDIIMQRKWGNYWRTINLSKPWSSRVKYAVKFSAGKNYSIRFIGYKEDPFDDVKWSFGSIDPVWKGIGEYKVVSIAGRKYTPHALTEFHLPIEFKLYFDLHLTKNDFTKLIRKRIGKFNITAWGIDYLVNESYNVTVYDYGNCTQLIEVTNVSCSDLGYEMYNSTHCFYNYTCVIGSHQETRYRLVWKPIPNSFTIKANKIYVIDLWARKKPSLGFAAVDIIPKIKNYQLSKLAWWNSSWQYRKQINITEQSGNTLTNYQVAINLTYDSDMNSDFSDIRFTYYNSTSDTETEIPYWIEDKVDSSWAYVWVKVPEIPASLTATIYIYYGNTIPVSSESNGTKVFLIFDYFDDGTITSTLDVKTAGSGSVIETNGVLKFNSPATTDAAYVISDNTLPSQYEIRLKANLSSGLLRAIEIFTNYVLPSSWSTNEIYHKVRIGLTPNIWFSYRNTDGTYYYWDFTNNVWTTTGVSYTGSSNTWYILKIIRNDTYYKFCLYDSNENLLEDPCPVIAISSVTGTSGLDYLISGEWATSHWTLDGEIDELRIRKYTDLEPSYSIGAKETPNQPPFVDTPKTYDENYAEQTSFSGGDKVVIRVNVTDPQGAEDIDKVLIEIIDNSSVIQVSNETMTKMGGDWYSDYSSWSRRRPVNITEQSGNTLTDYQVALNITYDSDMQSDFDDLRFTYSNASGEYEIPYWIEDKVDGSWAYVWVKVPEIPANDNATIYVYYGNPSATSESNGEEVFDIFDDFNDGTITADLDAKTAGSGSVSETNNVLDLNSPSASDSAYVITDNTLPSKFVVKSKIKEVSGSFRFETFTTYINPAGFSTNAQYAKVRIEIIDGSIYFVYRDASGSWYYWNFDTNSWSTTASSYSGSTNIWYIFEIKKDINDYHFCLYDSNENLLENPCPAVSITSVNGGSGNDYFVLGEWATSHWSLDGEADNFIVRKYADPEPSYSIGAEETNELANTYEYNYTLPTVGASGLWTINVYANDTQNAWGYNTTTFEAIINQPPFQPYNLTEPTDPSTYNYIATYTFKAYITDLNGATDISTVLFESNFSGTLTNYTVSNYVVVNSTTREYNLTFNSLPAGYYVYRWYVNDTQNALNASDQQTFTINKATPTLSLTASPSWTVTYPTETTVTGSENNDGDDDLTYNLYRNGALIGSGSSVSDVKTFAAGSYNYVYNTSGGQNYTSNSISNTLTVNKGTPEVSLYLNGTRGDKTYELGTIANFTADINTAYPVTLYLNSNYTGWTLQSGTSPLTYITSPLMNLGVWSITAYFEGDENYTSDLETHYFTVEDTTPPAITFISQSPADVSSTNIVVQNLNITYNITDLAGINASSVKLYYKTNRSSDEIVWFINGTAYSGFQECDNQTNVSSVWNFFLDYQIYPGTYSLPDEVMEAETKQHFNLDAKTDILKVRFFNVSSDKEYNYIVLDVQNQTVDTEFLRFYYCNESYTSGNPKLSDYCIEFYDLEPGMPHNYSKDSSLYWIVPLAINSTTGKIGNVKVTPTSYILLRSSANAGGWNISYVTNISRTDTVQYSTNNGIAYSNFSGTVDMRIHQFDGSDSLWYYVCADDVNENSNCSSLRQDLLELDNLPPTSPDVYSPTEGSYSGLISINYTESISPNAYPIANYTIYLTYLNKTTYTKIADNDLNLGYIWDSTSVPNGQYYIKVVACDNLGQCSHGYSENITIINLPSIKAELTTNAILLTTNATGCGCGPDYSCIWVQPENQTSVLGIFNLTNNGTISGDFQAKLTGTPNTGWTLYLSPTSDTADAIQLTTSWQTIHSNVAVNESKLVWLFVDCDHVSIGPGVNIEFRAV